MEVTDLNWRKASYSNGGANACIEVANKDVVLVRDTTDRSGPVLAFTTSAWETFAAKVKAELFSPNNPACWLSLTRGCFVSGGMRWFALDSRDCDQQLRPHGTEDQIQEMKKQLPGKELWNPVAACQEDGQETNRLGSALVSFGALLKGAPAGGLR